MSTAAIATVMNALLEKFCDEDGNINVPQDELVKAFQSMKTTAPRGRKPSTKAPRDPDAPKRPTSSYMLWLNENRTSIKDEHFPKNESGEHCFPDDHENAGEALQGRSKVTEPTKKAGLLWKEISADEKKPYEDAFIEAQSVYREAKGDYTPKESKTPKVSHDNDERPDAPEDWSGPFESNYISKVSKDPETGKNIKPFKEFDEAVAMANNLGEGCSGITKTGRGYSLRIGPELRSNDPNDASGLASWSKGEASLATPKASPSPKASPAPAPVDVDGSDVEVEADANVEVEADADVEKPKKVSAKALKAKKAVAKTEAKKASAKTEPKKSSAKAVAKAKKALLKVMPVAEVEAESEDESDDESDDEMEVEQINIDGEDYFMNEKTGDIYHPETQEIVGKSKKGKHTIF